MINKVTCNRNNNTFRLFGLALVISLFLNACIDLGDNASSTETANNEPQNSAQNDDLQKTFNETSSLLISQSVTSMPKSLSKKIDKVEDQGTLLQLRATNSSEGDEDEGMIGFYAGITEFISLADEMLAFVKEITVEMVKNPLLRDAQLGQKMAVPDSITSADPDSPTSFMVKRPGGDYEWEVYLFWQKESNNPEMIIRFTIIESKGAKGQILWSNNEEDPDLLAAQMPGIQVTTAIEATFDGSQSVKTLDIKISQDLDETIAYAKQNWASLTDTQREALDIGQPTMVLISTQQDDVSGEYTISGLSYHPTWKEAKTIDPEEVIGFPDDRQIYLFKAKAATINGIDGAKMFVALPQNTLTDTSSVWQQDSVGNVLVPIMKRMIINDINSTLEIKMNETDEPDLDYDSDDDGMDDSNENLYQEKTSALFFLQAILGGNKSISDMLTRNGPYSESEFNLIKEARQEMPHPDFAGIFLDEALTDKESLNSFLETDHAQAIGMQAMVAYYYTIGSIRATITERPSGYLITETDLDALLANPNEADGDLQVLVGQLRFIINPAFFVASEQGPLFLGTSSNTTNDTNDEYFVYDALNDRFLDKAYENVPDFDAKVATMKTFQPLNLDNIPVFVPAEVIETKIVVE